MATTTKYKIYICSNQISMKHEACVSVSKKC